MKYVTLLLGARRNPEINNKKSNSIVFFDYYKKDIEESGKSGLGKYYISFTDIPKLGINPNNEFDTPIGVYGYPVKTIYNKFKNNKIPFASERPYIQVFELATDKVLYTKKYPVSQYKKDCKKLEKLFEINKNEIEKNAEKVFIHLTNFVSFKDYLERVYYTYVSDEDDYDYNSEMYEASMLLDDNKYKEYKDKKCSYFSFISSIFYSFEGIEFVSKFFGKKLANARNKSYKEKQTKPFFVFWWMTRILSMLLANNPKENTVKWNKLFREIGYEVIVDGGYGMIHPHEPTQAVFFTPKAYKHINTLMNTSLDFVETDRGITNKNNIQEGTIIEGDLNFEKDDFRNNLPNSIKVNGKVTLPNRPIKVPDTIEANEIIINTNTSLLPKLIIAERIIVKNKELNTLPKMIFKGNDSSLDIKGNRGIEKLENINVKTLNIEKSNIKDISTVTGINYLLANNSKLEKLPDELICQVVYINNTNVTELPDNLKVQKLAIDNLNISKYPSTSIGISNNKNHFICSHKGSNLDTYIENDNVFLDTLEKLINSGKQDSVTISKTNNFQLKDNLNLFLCSIVGIPYTFPSKISIDRLTLDKAKISNFNNVQINEKLFLENMKKFVVKDKVFNNLLINKSKDLDISIEGKELEIYNSEIVKIKGNFDKARISSSYVKINNSSIKGIAIKYGEVKFLNSNIENLYTDNVFLENTKVNYLLLTDYNRISILDNSIINKMETNFPNKSIQCNRLGENIIININGTIVCDRDFEGKLPKVLSISKLKIETRDIDFPQNFEYTGDLHFSGSTSNKDGIYSIIENGRIDGSLFLYPSMNLLIDEMFTVSLNKLEITGDLTIMQLHEANGSLYHFGTNHPTFKDLKIGGNIFLHDKKMVEYFSKELQSKIKLID